MSNADFVLTADAEFDDLPRTLRRERDAREKEKRDRQDRERAERGQKERTARDDGDRKEMPLPRGLRAADTLSADGLGADSLRAPRQHEATNSPAPTAYPSATVKRFDVPFIHMMMFLLKAVVAAVPALILLGAILWGMGQVVKAFFPWLLQMQIYIQFPN